MSNDHPFRGTNPKHLDCGELIDAETGDYLRWATAREASRSIRAQRIEGPAQGVIETTIGDQSVRARVRSPEGMKLDDWRLAVALKLKWERELDREWKRREREARENPEGDGE